MIVKIFTMMPSGPHCRETLQGQRSPPESILSNLSSPSVWTQSSDFNLEAGLNVTSSVFVVMNVSGFALWEEMAAGT